MSDKYDFVSHPNHYNGHVVLGKKKYRFRKRTISNGNN